MGRGVLLQHERRLSAIRRESDDAIVIFGGAGAGSVQERAHNTTDTKTMGKFNALTKSKSLEFKVPMLCLSTACVSRPRERH